MTNLTRHFARDYAITCFSGPLQMLVSKTSDIDITSQTFKVPELEKKNFRVLATFSGFGTTVRRMCDVHNVHMIFSAFLRDTSPYLRQFRRKPRKNSERLGRQARPGIEHCTSRLPVLKHRIAQPLVGPRTDSFSIHTLTGI